MKKYFHLLIVSAVLSALASCSATKYVPDGSYLLDEIKIRTDNKAVRPSALRMYVRQNPNAKWFSLIHGCIRAAFGENQEEKAETVF